MPLDRWFREDLRGHMSATLGASDARVGDHLESGAVNYLIAEHQGMAEDPAVSVEAALPFWQGVALGMADQILSSDDSVCRGRDVL